MKLQEAASSGRWGVEGGASRPRSLTAPARPRVGALHDAWAPWKARPKCKHRALPPFKPLCPPGGGSGGSSGGQGRCSRLHPEGLQPRSHVPAAWVPNLSKHPAPLTFPSLPLARGLVLATPTPSASQGALGAHENVVRQRGGCSGCPEVRVTALAPPAAGFTRSSEEPLQVRAPRVTDPI